MDFPIALDNKLFPMQAFFNGMPDRDFIDVLESFARGVGAGFNDAVCELPDELEDGEEMFSGVKFYIFDEELIVSPKQFLECLHSVCLMYLGRNPDNRKIIEDLFRLVAEKVNSSA